MRVLLFIFILLHSQDKVMSLRQTGPVFIYEPPDQVNFMNTVETIVDCSGHGNPNPRISWTTEGGTGVRNVAGLLQILQNGSLSFEKFAPNSYDHAIHSSVYRCQLTNIYGTIVSRPVHLKANVYQQYVPRVYDEYFIKGNTAVMKCHIPSYVKDNIFVTAWIKDDHIIATKNIKVSESSKYIITPTGNLHVNNVNVQDQNASFKCKTKHQLRHETEISTRGGKIFITGTDSGLAPTITDFLTKLNVREGNVILIPCAAQGHPAPIYTWKKLQNDSKYATGTVTSRMVVGGSLYLDKVTLHDDGMYECIASNSVGTDKKNTKLTVKVPLQAYILPEQQVLSIGQPLIIKCSASGNPIDSITWFKDGQSLNRFGAILQLNRTDENNVGSYQCFVTNHWSTAQASTSIIAGGIKPKIVSSFKDSVLKPKEMITIECRARGKPTPEITWKRDGEYLSDTQRIRITNSIAVTNLKVSSVRITDIMVADGGEYSCIATNSIGNASHTSRINVYGPTMIRKMRNMTVVEGQDIKIQCYAVGHPLPRLTWHKGRRKLRGRRISVSDNGMLVIKDSQASKDNGRYTCVAVNAETGSKISNYVWIDIIVKPKIDKFGSRRVANHGNSLTLTCFVVSGTQPIEIRWLKGGQSIPFDLDPIISQTSDSSTVKFKRVESVHEDNYTCVARNLAGTDAWTTQIIIQAKPSIVTSPSDTWIARGSNVIFNCEASGRPTPVISWTINDEEINDFKKYKLHSNGSLQVINAEVEDEGLYTCIATNGVDPSATSEGHLFIGESPRVEGSKQTVFINPGASATLICTVRGAPPLNARWYQDGVLINVNRFEIKNTGLDDVLETRLRFNGSSTVNPMRFECIGSNRFGTNSRVFQTRSKENQQVNTIQNYPKSSDNYRKSVVNSRKKNRNKFNQSVNNLVVFTTNVAIMKATQLSLSPRSSKHNSRSEKITFLQILIASSTTAVIVLLSVLLLLLILLWKKKSSKRESQQTNHDDEVANRGGNTEERYGQLAKSNLNRSCETLTGSGYYAKISPYAQFNVSDVKRPDGVEFQTINKTD
ncbi:Uncharacterised protein g7634 [Pycnogonum litorale]